LLSSALPAFAPAQSTFESLARAALARLEGRLALTGLRDSVRVLRDAAGVPHIYAQNIDDLFFAQGFVQAQDRLWQMDMYRRTYEGRLAEIMGPTYVQHDRLARLLRYRGPWDEREYGRYHPEGKRILNAFARGVNAFIEQAGENLPVEFKLTGLKPAPWTAEVALLRTQTAMPTADARSELTLARNVAQFGAEEANRRARPDPNRPLAVPPGLDVSSIDPNAIAGLNGLRSGAPRPALLAEYARWADALPSENRGAQENSPGSNNWVVSGALTRSGKVIVANDPHRNVSNPSIRYIVHLVAPGWNVIGATEPPLPGVMIGHNGRIAWGLTILGTDQSDVYVEEVNPANRNEVRWRGSWEPLRIVRDTIRVKDQAPVVIELKFSRHGPIFHEDTIRKRAYAMRSTMHEPGSAGYLSALRYHAIDNCQQFLDAQQYYHAPTENMICGDVQGNIAWHGSGLSPKRSGWDGRLPVPGTGEFEWQGFRNDLPRELNPERGWIATANHNVLPPDYDPPLFFKSGNSYPRFDRLKEVFSKGNNFTVASFERLQHDSYSAQAARDLELFRGWTAGRTELEPLRALLESWDARYERRSPAAALYNFVSRSMTDARRDGLSQNDRRAALERALAQAVDTLEALQGANPAQWRWGRLHRSEFPHSLVRAYDIPAVERSGGAGTVAATGATYRQIIDLSDLDNSRATNTPGQSGQPGSPFYSNLAQSAADQQYFPLLYSQSRIEASAKHKLVLVGR
jgi:penicillin amidase